MSRLSVPVHCQRTLNPLHSTCLAPLPIPGAHLASWAVLILTNGAPKWVLSTRRPVMAAKQTGRRGTRRRALHNILSSACEKRGMAVEKHGNSSNEPIKVVFYWRIHGERTFLFFNLWLNKFTFRYLLALDARKRRRGGKNRCNPLENFSGEPDPGDGL